MKMLVVGVIDSAVVVFIEKRSEDGQFIVKTW